MGVPYMGVGGRLTDHEIKNPWAQKQLGRNAVDRFPLWEDRNWGKNQQKGAVVNRPWHCFLHLGRLENLESLLHLLFFRGSFCMLHVNFSGGVIHFYPKNNPWTWMFNKFEITSSFRRVSKMSKNHPKLFHGFTRWAKLGEHTQLKWP